MINLKDFQRRVKLTDEDLKQFKMDIENNNVKIITMGESTPLMNHRQFMFDQKEEAVDMFSTDENDQEYKEIILGVSQRIDKIFRILGGGS